MADSRNNPQKRPHDENSSVDNQVKRQPTEERTPAASQRLPDYHEQLIKLMRLFNYPISEDGVCFGVSLLGAHAGLIHRLADFQIRNKLIHDIISQHGARYLHKLINATKDNLADKSVDLGVGDSLTLSDREQAILDIHAFLDNISLAQAPEEYGLLFDATHSQIDAALLMKFISSQAMEILISSGTFNYIRGVSNTVDIIQKWCGVYSNNELDEYFNGLNAFAIQGNNDFALLLRSAHHAISLNYLAQKQKWSVCDANNLFGKREHNQEAHVIKTSNLTIQEVLSYVKIAYPNQNQGYRCLATTMMSLPIEAHTLRQRLNTLFQSTSFRSIHHVTKAKTILLFDTNPDESETRLIHLAAQMNDIELLNKIFQVDPLLECTKNTTLSPFAIAAQFGHHNFLLRLQDLHVDITATDDDNATALFAAAAYNHIEVAHVLINAGVNVNLQALSTGSCALHIACNNGNVALTNLLIQNGADVNLKTQHDTALHIAIDKNQTDILQLLLTAPNVNVNIAFEDGITPLHLAVRLNRLEMVKMLLEAGANPNLTLNTAAKQTPSLLAASRGYAEMLVLFANHGVDLTAPVTEGGFSPLTAAEIKNHQGCVDFINSIYRASSRP